MKPLRASNVDLSALATPGSVETLSISITEALRNGIIALSRRDKLAARIVEGSNARTSMVENRGRSNRDLRLPFRRCT
jgi:hypothetical protein